MSRVLITSVGRKVSLVRAFKESGWEVCGQDINLDSIALKYCDHVYRDNPAYEEGFYKKGTIWIPTRDAEILDAWAYNGWNTDGVEIALDKFRFYKWCKENGLRTPEVYFVKPRISKSGKETECVWQELVEGDEYSVDLFADFDGNVISVVPRKRLLVVGGESVHTVTVSHASIISETVLLASKLGLIGHNVLQCFEMKDGKLFWTDVNCRFGGASIVGIEAGCKSPEWLLKLVRGEKLSPVIGEYQVGLVGKSFADWLFNCANMGGANENYHNC